MSRPDAIWKEIIDQQTSRLRAPLNWFPYPCLISVVLALIFTSHVLLGLNPRLGNPAVVMVNKSKPEQEGSIWFSVTGIGNKTIVTTADRKVFTIPVKIGNPDALTPFTDYLKRRTEEISLTAGLAKKVNRFQTMAVIATDQKCKYLHLRPVLYALARSGISNYGFETKQPMK